MNNIQVKNAYADWLSKTDYNLFITLNTEVEYTETELAELISKLFYKIECDVFGYKNRELYKTKCRVSRVVAIESKYKRTHAHIKVQTLADWTDAQMLELIKLDWQQITNTKQKDFLFNASVIANSDAVSNYIVKDMRLNDFDVINLQASFISKHSNKQ